MSRALNVFIVKGVKGSPLGASLENKATARVVMAFLCGKDFWLGYAHWLAHGLVNQKGCIFAASTLSGYFGTSMHVADLHVSDDANKAHTTEDQKKWLKTARESGKTGFLSKVTKRLIDVVNLKRRRAGLRVSK